MKKVLFGLIIGLVLGSAISVGATSKMFGKKVDSEFAIVVDGVTIDIRAIGIDGSSYIPLRAAGNLFGFDVDFIDWQVILNSKVEEEPPLVDLDEGDILGTKEYNFVMSEDESQSFNKLKVSEIESYIRSYSQVRDSHKLTVRLLLEKETLTDSEEEKIEKSREYVAQAQFYIDYLTELKAQKEGK